MLTLVAPDVALHASWLAAHREWGPGLHEDGFGIAAEDDVDTVEGFSRFVERVRTRPTARLWWVLDDDLVVGGIALRHADAPNVLKHGHLGYGVRPSWRGKGVATWALGAGPARLPRRQRRFDQDHRAPRRAARRGGHARRHPVAPVLDRPPSGEEGSRRVGAASERGHPVTSLAR
jgi:GNAT superfamily N-acetyltransferase